MKLKLTKEEAERILSEQTLQFGTSGDFVYSVEISDDVLPQPDYDTLATRLQNQITAVQELVPGWCRDKKIAAIKRFKDITGHGLVDSKFAIENSGQAVANVRQTGRIIV